MNCIVLGYDGPGKDAAVVECRHFTDADAAAEFRQQNRSCFRFVTVNRPSGTRKPNGNYDPSASIPDAKPTAVESVIIPDAKAAADALKRPK